MIRPCRCLIGEMPDEAELAKIIRERIDGIPEEERTPEREYAFRLSASLSASEYAIPDGRKRLPSTVAFSSARSTPRALSEAQASLSAWRRIPSRR